MIYKLIASTPLGSSRLAYRYTLKGQLRDNFTTSSSAVYMELEVHGESQWNQWRVRLCIALTDCYDILLQYKVIYTYFLQYTNTLFVVLRNRCAPQRASRFKVIGILHLINLGVNKALSQHSQRSQQINNPQ